MIDTLTRIASLKALEERLLTCKHPKLFLVDIKNFKAINLDYGDEGGNFVLRTFALALSSFAQEQNMELFRVRNDQFALLLEIPFELATLEKVIFALCDVTQKREYVYEGKIIPLETHMGISFDHFNALEKAYKALLVAKTQNQPFATYSEFANILMGESEEEIGRTIKESIETGKINLLFQAIVDDTKTPCYYEALLRMECHQGLQSPKLFIAIARQKNVYDHLLSSIVHKITGILDKNPTLHLGINLSSSDLLEPNRLEFLRNTLKDRGIILEIQCDEVSHFASIAPILPLLKAEGFRIALDNVEELALIEACEVKSVDYVKIHGDLVRNLELDATLRQTCEALVTLCHTKEFKVIATHLNAKNAFDVAHVLPFDFFQGYSFEQPHPLE